jgi:predicted NBD/HSP70 family sugar kinase
MAAEPGWAKVAHAMLIHGRRLTTPTGKRRFELSQEDFWPLVVGIDGRTPAPETSDGYVKSLMSSGWFLKNPLRFGPKMGLVVGIAIGTESLRAALFDANGEIAAAEPTSFGATEIDGQWYRCREAEPLEDQLSLSPERLMRRMAALAKEVLAGAILDPALLVDHSLPLLGVAVAWPGSLSRGDKFPTGRVLRHPDWTAAGSAGVADRVAERFGLDRDWLHVVNDANAVALSVAFDQSRSDIAPREGRLGETTLVLRIAGGLGAGTVVLTGQELMASRTRSVVTGIPPRKVVVREDVVVPRSTFLGARLLEGSGGFAGELGHWVIPDQDLRDVVRRDRGTSSADDPVAGLEDPPRLPCRCCGRPGCLETYASVHGFVARIEASGIGVEGLRSASRRARSAALREIMAAVRDERQLRAQRDIGRLIGCSLSAPILMLNPGSVWLSGSLAVPEVKAGIDDEVARWRHVHRGYHDLQIRLVEGRHSAYAPARGAALAAFRGRVFRRLGDPRTLQGLTLAVGDDFVAHLR